MRWWGGGWMMSFHVDTGLDPLPVASVLVPCPLAAPSCSAPGLAYAEQQQKLLSERRGKGHKTFIALANRQGNVCLG